MSIESVMPSNHLILCCPLLLSPSIFHSIRVFSNESPLRIRWPKYCVSASTSVFSMNIQAWFPLGLTGWISLLSKGLSRVFSNTTVQKHQFFSTQLSLWSISHIFNSHLCYVSSVIQWWLCSVSSSFQDPGWWSSFHLRHSGEKRTGRSCADSTSLCSEVTHVNFCSHFIDQRKLQSQVCHH